ncbi:eCIS core domain-containing protein [Microscilla marina]|uniref:DUF4157 domain-containing protein n=1 Tax=Microscilla marina ATCC 23134 TaxID=313606 RepID=A1ZND9_MICM2|nr:DUF4157 domain-containing protein [Microscilla marina]EAY28050.1 hypothetical protein M23134_02160 [Microscilla marina ATCC 23134]
MQKKIKNEEAAQQPEVAQRKESKSNKKKAAIQAKSFGGKPLQPIQTKQKGQPPIQAKGFDGKPLQPIPTKQASQSPIQAKQQPIQRKSNPHGLPHQLQSNMENMGGVDLSDVKVHKNSDKPVQLNAHAYAQGSDIHLAPGQDKHLPHEAWHVVQQKQGRVQATTQMKNSDGKVGINDNQALEHEADVMGEKAKQGTQDVAKTGQTNSNTPSTVQMKNAVVQRFKYSDAKYAKLYPRLTHYLKHGIKDVLNVPAIVKAMKKYGQLTKANLEEGLTWGKGPSLVIKPLAGAIGSFSPGIGSQVLNIDEDTVKELENAKGNDRDIYLFLVGETILHEYIHYGDDQDGVDYPGEEGDLFEKEVYGQDISGYDSAKKVVEAYKKKKQN